MNQTPAPVTTKEPINTKLRLDEHGRAIPFTEEEQAARTEVILKMLEKMAAIPDDDDCSDEAFMRAMDESHPDRPLFLEYYAP